MDNDQNQATSAQSSAQTDQPAGFYRTDEPVATTIASASDDTAISWVASEFIAQNKSTGWYLVLGIIAVVAAVLTYLLTKDITATVVIVLAAIIMGVYGARQPRQLQYALNSSGLQIGERYLPLNLFRSFSLVEEGAIDSIIFMPIKRFGQAITVYFDPNDEQRILDLLANRLPMENKTHDSVERLMRRIRF